MTRTSDSLFERRLSTLLHEVLDDQAGPHPTWADAPAARPVATREGAQRWKIGNLRLLAIAAVLAVGGAAAAGAFLRNSPTPPLPVPTLLPVPTNSPSVGVTGPTNGLIAYEVDGDVLAVRADGQRVSERWGGDGIESCPQFLRNGALAIAHTGDADSLWTITVDDFQPDGNLAQGGFALHVNQKPNLDDVCFAASADAQQFAFMSAPDADTPLGGLFLVDRAAVVQGHVLISPDGGLAQVGAFGWSPVGHDLAVAQAVEGSEAEPSRWAELWVVRPGRSPTPPLIESLQNEIIDEVAWSPDGSRIAYRGTIMQSVIVDGVRRSEPVGTFVRVIGANQRMARPSRSTSYGIRTSRRAQDPPGRGMAASWPGCLAEK
jgi:hypothetical protein